MKREHVNSITAASIVATLAGFWALAAPGAPEQFIPYQGRLEFGGVPYNGQVALTFSLDNAALDAADTLDWSETIDPVTVYDGAFAVLLGQNVSIPASAFDEAELYLSVSVDGTALLGKQKIHATPLATRASTAYDFSVTNDLSVGGAVSAATVAAGDVTASDTVTASGTMTIGNQRGDRRLQFSTNGGDELNAGSIGYRNFDPNALSIVGAGTNSTDRLVRIYDHLRVERSLTFPTQSREVAFGDLGYGNVIARDCAANEYVCGISIRLEPSQGGGDDTGVNGLWMRCCTFGIP